MRYELKVNRAELISGLNLLRKTAKPKKNMEAVLSFEKGNFVVFVNGVSIEASAEGEFPGLARIPAAQAITLSKVLPPEDPLTIAHDEKELYIGTFSMPCAWSNVDPHPIQLPIDAPLPLLLGLRLKYTDQQVFQSGYSNPLGEAERKRKLLITKASNALEPLGVKRADVEKLVDEAVRIVNKL
jgi:hypothetical protein